MSQWSRSALCGHPLPALTDNWIHGAASRHTMPQSATLGLHPVAVATTHFTSCVKVAQFSDFGLFSPYKTPKKYLPVTSLEPMGLHRRMILISLCGSRRSKGVPSGSGLSLRLLVGKLETPKVAQIFTDGKWLYPYKMQLHGASDLDQRCLKTRRSAVVAFLGVATKYPCPYPQKPHFGGLFNANPIIERALHKLHVNGSTKLKLYSYIGIGKYFSTCQNNSARGRTGAQS